MPPLGVMNGGFAIMTSASSFQCRSLVRVSYSSMCGSTSSCRYMFSSAMRTMPGSIS